MLKVTQKGWVTCGGMAGLGCGQKALEAEVTLGERARAGPRAFSRPGPPRAPAACCLLWEWAPQQQAVPDCRCCCLLCGLAGEETPRAKGLLGCSGRAG